jgi:hypothetical protein
MRLPRVRFTIRRLMVVVAIVALILTSSIYAYRCIYPYYRNWMAYSEWSGDTSPNRPSSWPVPYP